MASMSRVLLTAFQPYERWAANASWLAIVELTRDLPARPVVTTRLYPVDYRALFDRIRGDIAESYDYVIHTGQAPGRARIELETVAINLASFASSDGEGEGEGCRPLIEDGPVAYASSMPADALCQRIRSAGIPAGVSRHGGTYLCNAALYYTLHQIATQQLPAQAIFIHLPLDTSQAAQSPTPIPCLPAAVSAEALRNVLASLVRNEPIA
jgi:pyroglutamyl-peptidase